MKKTNNTDIRSTLLKVSIIMIAIVVISFAESYYWNDIIARAIGCFGLLEFIAGIVLFKGLRSIKE